jgi:hypothetical protein
MHDSMHAPAAQTCWVPQACPHFPQFLGSVAVFVHVVPHSVLGGEQDDVSRATSAGPTSTVESSALGPSSPEFVEPAPLAHAPLHSSARKAAASGPERE